MRWPHTWRAPRHPRTIAEASAGPPPLISLPSVLAAPPAAEPFVLLLSTILLGALVGAAEALHRYGRWRQRTTRRLVHVGTGLYVVVLPYLFDHVAPVLLLAGTFVLVNGLTTARGWLRGMHPASDTGWGTIAFPLALLVIAPLAWTPERIHTLQIAFLVLAVADPLASAVGERWPVRVTRIGTATKSLGGSVAFLAAAFLLTAAGLLLLGPRSAGLPLPYLLLVASLASVVATAVEALGGRGWDNLFVVIAVVVVLLLGVERTTWLPTMAVGAGLGVVFAWLTARAHFLDSSGAIAGGLFAATLIGIGGAEWIVPGLTFFVLSSLISRWSERLRGEATGGGEGSRRDAVQVLANGGVAWLLVVVHALEPAAWIYWGFVGSLAAAAADTWATEIGPLFDQRPRMVLSGRAVPPGTSGAITMAGTLAGLVGAVAVWSGAWLTAVLVAPEAAAAGIWTTMLAVVAGGVLGSLADSVAGATIQAVYRDPAQGALFDGRASTRGGLIRMRGWRGVNNDVVNALCTAVGALVAIGVVVWGG